ncbi:CaiF/GrlA family transcriptional regulator [Salmonella enterica subsp. enterica]|uniref:CaiF/GrlA family transcriptional regulator n=1 Tax=Salmonella enterica TaxID=28901 RepID=UPI00107CB889|nr:CaiF/GrlA family transcriptional regulator [Salmonella enterica]EAB6708041.1 CaiF/GrlA family transcriptional regulator [Salmonella enterica subsp. enterica serovar Brandenburg]EBG6822382.1 CaiF/GrlA family transcriptional regulator [Salmonella enterica subsp. enterica]EBY2673362.1 CaiF/GrlA family transcriptional regulator [Salmonella enterica subsp. enterica serovar Schwarzengrund]EGP2908402.1 CaiF/GrlA family transcriptional regulator [Salmonella enterica subsp. enterica serovar Muenster]
MLSIQNIVRETGMKCCNEDFHECDGWLSPVTIKHIDAQVLYQAVAHWALLQGRGVTVKEVSKAFGIPVRRASDVLHYIVNKASNSIEVSISQIPGEGNGRQKVVRVWRVYPQRFPQEEKVSEKISGLRRNKHFSRRTQPDGETQRLRTWFLSRRSGETLQEGGVSGLSEEDAGSAQNGQDC